MLRCCSILLLILCATLAHCCAADARPPRHAPHGAPPHFTRPHHALPPRAAWPPIPRRLPHPGWLLWLRIAPD